jgi:rubrerythrin
MDIGSIFLILALLVLVILYISRPFFEREAQPVAEEVNQAEHERSSLLAERDRLLNALQELDFDHALGKIPAEDYPEQRQRLLHNGADVLRRLDALQPQADAEDAEMRLEAAIAERRADARQAEAGVQAAPAIANARKSAVAVAGADDDLEKLLADRRRKRREKATGFCPQCGGPVHKSDRFCPKCGGKIA